MKNKLEIVYSIPLWKEVLLDIVCFLLYLVSFGLSHNYGFDKFTRRKEYLNRKRLVKFLYNNCITEEEIQENIKEISKSSFGTFFYFQDFHVYVNKRTIFVLFDKNEKIVTSGYSFSNSQKKVSNEIVLVLKYIEKVYTVMQENKVS